MKHGIFNQPIAPKERKSSSTFAAPKYDEQKKMYPSGDYYGTGFKAKVGKMRSSPTSSPIPQKSMRIAPKSLA
jgi:hypothetical protein